jgi:hypothetical protein
VIAYQMLTGALPYGTRVAGATSPAAQRGLRYRPAREHAPELPDWVDAALGKALAVDPARRYQELSEFVFDMAHPNPALIGGPLPLFERGTVRTWRIATFVLAIALAIALLSHPALGLL